MVQIPEQQTLTPEQAFEQLQVWFGMQQQLASLKTAEVLARQRMGTFYFPEPTEGTNRLPLGGGFDLKLDHKVNRVVDEAALNALGGDAKALKQIEKLGIPMSELFVQKWDLSIGAYRTLNDAQRQFVDALLNIKEGTPALSIVPAANTEGAAAHKAAAEAAAPTLEFDINLGEEKDTAPNQFFKDGGGVWWLLNDDSEWVELEPLDDIIPRLEAQVAAMTAKPKRTRKPRAGKGGAK